MCGNNVYISTSKILNNQFYETNSFVKVRNLQSICFYTQSRTKYFQVFLFIENFSLQLVHIHANNFAPIRLDDGLPLVLELTFSKYSKVLNETYLPHKFDMSNNKNRPEINIKIKN